MITYGSTTLTSYNTITKIEVYYYKSTSATSLSGGSWSTTKPTWENGKYIWQKIRTTYEGKLENGQFYSESDPVNITGQQGATGTAAYSYKLNTSDTIVSVSKNGTYSTNSVTFSATSKQGNGDVNAYAGRFKIETTTDGITWTTQYTSDANEPSKDFTIPNDISNIRCSLYQSGGMTVLLDIVSVSIVRDGTDATGLKDSIPFYLASDKETGITIYDEGWSTLRPALDATNKYLWVYYLSRYSDGTTDPELIEVSGDIVTFENDGDVSPIYNTIVDIEPIQDLNGFDHAWNGGDGKNLLVYPYSVGDTYTSHDVTFTVEKYPNGAVKDILINGTASTATYFNFSTWASGSSAKTDLSKYVGQSLIISGGTSDARIVLQYRKPNSTSNIYLANDTGTGVTFTVPNASDLGTWAIFISISSGSTFNNVRVYPMLRFASEIDGTYEPYENICPINGWDNVKIERTGKNLLVIKYPNRTNNGITFTVNGSTITANGTATSNAWSCTNLSGITTSLQYKNLIPPGQYMLTGGKSTDKRVYLTGNYLNGKSITIVNDYGSGALYTLTDWAYVYPQVQITSGTTVENEVFNIQLEATTIATEYEPYCGNTYEIDFPTEAGNIFKGKLVIDENGDGQLIQTHKSIILDNTNRNGYNFYSPNIRPYWTIDDKALFSSYIEANNHIYTDSCIISGKGVITSTQDAKVQALSAYTTKVVYVTLINITTQEAMDAYLADHPIQLVYELAEPIIYHLTAKQILAVLKTNHIYANTGNTTVRYYDNQKVTAPYIDYSTISAFEYSAEALDKIDNLEIGGRNLLRMSSMSSQDASISNSNTDFTEYFRRYNGNASQHTFEKIADGVYQDTVALNTSGNLGVAFGRLVSEFNFDYTSEYTLSCWAKCTKENTHLDIGLSYYKNDDTWVWRGGTNPQNFKEINKWQFFKLTFKPDADTKAICYCFTVKGETNGIDSFTIRNCKLEKGNKPTDWSPAPEDVEESIKAYAESIQSQVDGMAEIHYGTDVPTLSNAPYTSWEDTTTKDMHVDDLYYNTSTGYCYRFTKSGSTYSWVRIKDSDITAAATAASNANTAAGNAQTTANNANTLAGQKRRIFVSQPTPPYEVGDLWVEGSNGDIKKCKTARATGSYTASDWELASKYTDDTTANTANTKVDNLKKVRLGWKVNYSAYGTVNNGECYFHGYDANNAPADINGIVEWNGADLTITKGMWINPNQVAPYNTPILHVYRTDVEPHHADVWWDETLKKWRGYMYKDNHTPDTTSNSTSAAQDWTWNEITDCILATYISSGSEGAITSAQLFNPPKKFSEISDPTLAHELVDNLEVGGRNLFIGTSRFHGENNAFVTESNKLDNYYTYFNNGSIYTLEPFHEGDTITLQAKSNIPWNNKHAIDGTGVNTVGFWIQAFDTSEDAKNRQNLKRSQFLTNDLGDNSVIFKKKWTIPASDNGKYYCFRFNSYSDGTTVVTAKFWDLKLEKGNKATDWTPAPEDTQADIDTAFAQSVEYIIGTQTAATGNWTGVSSSLTELKDGTQIRYWLPYAGSGNATLNLTLKDGTSTGAIPIYRQGGSANSSGVVTANRVTTHFPAGTSVSMVYGVNRIVSAVYSGTTYTGTFTGWFADGAYDSGNTINRTRMQNAITAATAITAGRIICGTNSGYKNIGANIAFDLSYPLLYASSAITATKTGDNNYLQINDISASNNGTITSGGANKTLYLKGTVTGNTFTISASPFMTTVVPTSADGFYYIPLGLMYSATAIYFNSSNRLYAYLDGAFQPVDTAAILRAAEAKKTATNYMSSDNTGIMVADLADGEQLPANATGKNVFITAGYGSGDVAVNAGVHIRDGQEDLAFFGETAQIGKSDQGHIILDNDSVDIKNDDNVLASFGATSVIGDENDWHQTIAANQITFARGDDIITYISPDKLYTINAEVADAFYISNYSIRNASDGKLVIGLRR